MSKFKAKAGRPRYLFLVLTGVIFLSALCLFTMLNKIHPIDVDFAADEGVLLDWKYIDYLGYEHAGSSSDQKIIQKFSEILKGIQDENPRRVRKIEEKCGPINYLFVVKRGSKKLYYSLQGEYLAVGAKGLCKNYTIYQLGPASSEELVSFLRSVCD